MVGWSDGRTDGRTDGRMENWNDFALKLDESVAMVMLGVNCGIDIIINGLQEDIKRVFFLYAHNSNRPRDSQNRLAGSTIAVDGWVPHVLACIGAHKVMKRMRPEWKGERKITQPKTIGQIKSKQGEPLSI